MTSDDYLYGVDLYNRAYWWEAHEVFEGFWHAYGRTTEAGNFFQALIQCAAANLKRELGHEPATRKLVASGLARLRQTPTHYMGMHTAAFAEALTQWLNERAMSSSGTTCAVTSSVVGVPRRRRVITSEMAYMMLPATETAV